MRLKFNILYILSLLHVGVFAQGDNTLAIKYSVRKCKTGIIIFVSKKNISKADTIITYGKYLDYRMEYDSLYINQITDDSLIDPVLIRSYLQNQKIEASDGIFPSCILLYPGEEYKYKLILDGVSGIDAKYFVERYQRISKAEISYFKKTKHPRGIGRFLDRGKSVYFLIKL